MPDHFTVGILLFEEAEELDWVGPFEVFGMAFKSFPERHVVTIAESMEPVTCYNGLRVLPDYDFSSAPELDLILVPGGMQLYVGTPHSYYSIYADTPRKEVGEDIPRMVLLVAVEEVQGEEEQHQGRLRRGGAVHHLVNLQPEAAVE